MRLNDMFPSKFLRASDLDGDTIVTIKSLIKEEFQDGDKYVMYFFERGVKPWPLNKTNGKTIAGMYGDKVDDWRGNPITLYSTEIDFRGEPTEAIRVRKEPPMENKEENDDD